MSDRIKLNKRDFLRKAGLTTAGAVGATTLSMPYVRAQSPIKWRLQTYAGPALAEHVIKPAIDAFNKAANGEMVIELFTSDQLVPQGEVLVAAKHQSALETFGIVPFVGDFAFILKRELNWLPLFGWYTSRAGMIGVNRGARSQALRDMTAQARKVVADGRQIIIYPEGTRRPAGAEPSYKYGTVHLYSELGVPCVDLVPVLDDSARAVPQRELFVADGHCTDRGYAIVSGEVARALRALEDVRR